VGSLRLGARAALVAALSLATAPAGAASIGCVIDKGDDPSSDGIVGSTLAVLGLRRGTAAELAAD